MGVSPPRRIYIYIYMNERPFIIAVGYICIYIYVCIYHYISLYNRYFTVVVLYFLHFIGKIY